jgi:hypothetical protein
MWVDGHLQAGEEPAAQIAVSSTLECVAVEAAQ